MAQIALDEAEILTIVVCMDARGRGRGAGLLDDLLLRLSNRGARQVFLEVAEDNDAARALYHKTGFEEIARRAAYYKRADGPVDALVLRRDIGS